MEYEKFIHHISTLLLNHKYARAINVINFLISQGLKTHELIFFLSYAHKFVNGPSKALAILNQFKIQGPLIQYAKAEYLNQIGSQTSVAKQLGVILNGQYEGQIGEVYKSMGIFLQKYKKPPIYTEQDHSNYEAINFSNKITEGLQKGEMSRPEARILYKHILEEEQLEAQLKQQIEKNMKYLGDE